MSRTLVTTLIGFLATVLAGASFLSAGDGPRVLPAGQTPPDQRLKPLKDLNGYFPFEVPATSVQWEKRANFVRRRLVTALGLAPMPTKTPLRPVIHGRIEQGNYSVEKVFFESLPGFFVTGNLYRPLGKSGGGNSGGKPGRRPGVLCPHGHWSNGRFHDVGLQGVRQQIVQGAERFEEGGRSPLQARCVQLARMGCVVFHYDMIGYADSTQISYEVAHRFAKQRAEMNTPSNWGLFSPQAEAHLQSVMGLQTINSIRAVDFLSQLPDVDSSRLAVTGASGGGTQSFILSAVDPRVAVSFPAVMVSTAMQGGCTCENCSLLRIGTGNVEIAGLFAPKPLGLSAADDWTKEMATKGYPELQQLYEMLGVPQNVTLTSLTHFGHNYNYVSRAAMYSWLNKHFKLGHPEPIVEEDFQRLSTEEMTVWNDQHPRPAGGDDFERKLLRGWTKDTERQLTALAPKDEKSLFAWRDLVGGAMDVVIGRGLPQANDVEWEQKHKTDRGGHLEILGMLYTRSHGEALPMAFLYPKSWDKQVVIWSDEDGKAGLFEEDGSPIAPVQRLLDEGVAVAGVDLLYQGEFLADGKPPTKTRRVANTREAAAYTFGFNSSLFARRVHDILSVIIFVRNHDYTPEKVDLIALGKAGPWAAAARAQARDAVRRAAIDTAGFRFGKVRDLHDVNFLPGGAKYGDTPALLALAAPEPLWLAGEGDEAPAIVQQAYRAAGNSEAVTVYDGDAKKKSTAAIAWLLK